MQRVTPEEAFDPFEFWRLEVVERKTGLGKTTIYERMKETDPSRNPFPASRAYRGGRGTEESRSRYWISGEVRDWQRREVGLDPITITPTPAPADVAELMG